MAFSKGQKKKMPIAASDRSAKWNSEFQKTEIIIDLSNLSFLLYIFLQSLLQYIFPSCSTHAGAFASSSSGRMTPVARAAAAAIGKGVAGQSIVFFNLIDRSDKYVVNMPFLRKMYSSIYGQDRVDIVFFCGMAPPNFS